MSLHIMQGANELQNFVEALPQELYDHIFEDVFTSKLVEECQVDTRYKPPELLHLDCSTRETFAQAYYSKTTFIFRSEDLFTKWIDSLPKVHKAMLKRIRFTDSGSLSLNSVTFPGRHDSDSPIYFGKGWAKRLADRLLIRLHEKLSSMRSDTGASVEVCYTTPDGIVRVVSL